MPGLALPLAHQHLLAAAVRHVWRACVRPREEAERHGVPAEQLVLTGTADLEVHVAYKSAADLFLDTALYNAHSTAADVLFAGVPMV